MGGNGGTRWIGTVHRATGNLTDAKTARRLLLTQHALRLQDVRNTVLQLGAETGQPEPLGAAPAPGNWGRITDYVPSYQVHIEYTDATPEHRPWRNIAGVRWETYGYTLGELVEMVFGAVATFAPGLNATQRYDVHLVLPQPGGDERILARVREAIESQTRRRR